ncbi:MAG: ABC transporter permease [Deinococcus sp.]|nr:ABC transporter permease [Deinococcus sp.]
MRLQFVLRRLIMLGPVVVGVTLVVFLLIHLAPGDPVVVMLGRNYNPEVAANLRHNLGLDRPLPVQYVLWLWRMAQGDLGTSLHTREPVAKLIVERAPTTLTLALGTMLVAILIGVPAGVVSATRQDTWFDNLCRLLAMLGVSMPVFWLGLLLIIAFAWKIPLFPPGGSLAQYGLKAMVLPSIALGASFAALITRMTRSSMLEVLRLDYVRTARAKGLAEAQVYYRHALKNSLIPLITVVGLQAGTILSGAVLTETIFALPGLGRLLTNSIGTRDFPLIQGCVLVTVLMFVLANLVVDLLYTFVDPRISYS